MIFGPDLEIEDEAKIRAKSEPIQRQLSLLEIMRRANTGKNIVG